jgi:polysaccharide biosynthesis protein PslA
MRTAQKLSHEIVPHYASRHCVKPGITGWAQVNGYRGAMNVEDDLVNRVKYDMDYIAKWSVVFDFYILFKTIFHLAGSKNAY